MSHFYFVSVDCSGNRLTDHTTNFFKRFRDQVYPIIRRADNPSVYHGPNLGEDVALLLSSLIKVKSRRQTSALSRVEEGEDELRIYWRDNGAIPQNGKHFIKEILLRRAQKGEDVLCVMDHTVLNFFKQGLPELRVTSFPGVIQACRTDADIFRPLFLSP